MCWHIVERVASASTGAKVVAWIVAKAMTLEVCMMGCSCKLGMILANLVLGSRWFVEEEQDAVVAKCNLLVLLIVHFCVRALPSFQLRLGIHWSNDLGPSHGNSKMMFFPSAPLFFSAFLVAVFVIVSVFAVGPVIMAGPVFAARSVFALVSTALVLVVPGFT